MGVLKISLGQVWGGHNYMNSDFTMCILEPTKGKSLELTRKSHVGPGALFTHMWSWALVSSAFVSSGTKWPEQYLFCKVIGENRQ